MKYFIYAFIIAFIFLALVSKAFAVDLYTGSKPDFSSNTQCNAPSSCFNEYETFAIRSSGATVYNALNCASGYSPPGPSYKSPVWPNWPTVLSKNSSYLKFIAVGAAGSGCAYSNWSWNGSAWSQLNSNFDLYYQSLPSIISSSYNFYFDDSYGSGAINGNYGVPGNTVVDLQLLYEAGYTGPPIASMSSQPIASSSGQYTFLNLSGNTATKSAQMHCTIGIFEKCSYNDARAGWTSSTPVAHIMLDALSPQTTTTDLGGGYYGGYGYSATSSAWFANGVKVPYNPGTFCTYPFSTTCYRMDNTNRTAEVSTLATGSASIAYSTPVNQGAGLIEPDPWTNPLGWVVWKITQNIKEMFIPNFDLTLYSYNSLKTNLYTHAPFAYVVQVVTLDFSNPGSNVQTPSLSVPVQFTDRGVPMTIEWSSFAGLDSILQAFRTGVSVMLWFMFVIYLISVVRRVFT